jgi:hypothetical protein
MSEPVQFFISDSHGDRFDLKYNVLSKELTLICDEKPSGRQVTVRFGTFQSRALSDFLRPGEKDHGGQFGSDPPVPTKRR